MDLETYILTKLDPKTTYLLFDQSRHKLMMFKERVLDYLKVVDPHEDTLKYLLIMELLLETASQLKGNSPFAIATINEASNFLIKFSKEYLKGDFGPISHDIFYYFAQTFVEQNYTPSHAIRVLLNPSEMTPLHAQVLKLCISGKMYSLGFSIGKSGFTVFNPNETGLNALDVMSYYYYYGYICTALKYYDKAVQAFRFVLVQPTHVLHKCMVSAYKKYIVVSLLAGKNPDFPKAGSEFMRSVLARLCSTYKDLADAMNAKNAKQLDTVIVKNKDIFFKDKNYNLVELLPQRLMKTRVLEMTQTYMTLSFRFRFRIDLAEKVKEKEGVIVTLIKDMIEVGELNARLDEKSKTVIFVEKEEGYDALGQKVTQQTEEIRAIMEDLKVLRDDIEVSKVYQRKLLRKHEFGFDMEDDD